LQPGDSTDDRGETAGAPLLELRGITKQFPGCLANDDVSLSIKPGEIAALLGENGAGKSTLVKIIYGVLEADQGEVLWQGQPMVVSGPAAARKLGIGLVFQHFSLFEGMTVLENIALSVTDAKDLAALRRRVVEVSEAYGLPLVPEHEVHNLSVGERQRIEIVRCLLQDPRLLIMDEPTSVLTPQEVDKLFETLRRVAAEGRSILYISHKLEEIKALCERAVVLRQGKVVGECDPAVESAKTMAEMMIGGKLAAPQRSGGAQAEAGAEPRLAVDGLSVVSPEKFGIDLKDIRLSLQAGEILGIAGVAGNGQTELMDALSGEIPGKPASSIRIEGQDVANLGPDRRRALAACFVPEERNGHAAVAGMSLGENVLLSGHHRLGLTRHSFIDDGKSADFAARVIESFDVRTSGTEAEAGSLSGGNLQKFIVGREVLQDPKLLIVSQPTWGVDAGAASTIHQALLDLAAAGTAVLVISQDLDEIFAICDRIAVISQGRLSEARGIREVTVEEIGLLMGGAGEAETAMKETGGAD
jgi:simple sugar transport system ATP-binding protein